MALMDTVRQLMKGRSATLERGVDRVMGQVGRYGDTLRRQAEVLKERARSLDEDRGPEPGTSARAAEAGASPPVPSPPEPLPAPAAPERPPLRGDLVDRGEPPTDPTTR